MQVVERASARLDSPALELLDNKLAEAKVVEPEEIPADIVTMNSRVLYQRLPNGEVREATLVYPTDASPNKACISILSPIGAALIGSQEGSIPSQASETAHRIQLLKITYQPEAAGDWNS